MDKRVYELTVILPADKTEKDIKSTVSGWLKKSGGKELKFDFWGKKGLTYAINNKMQGLYGYFELEMTPKQVAELQKRIKLDEEVMRHLLVIKNIKIKEE